MGAMAAVPAYASTRSGTQSDPSSRLNPPPRSPDRLLPGAAATRSVGTASHSHNASSDQSDYSQGDAPNGQTPSYHQQAPMSTAAAGYFNELPADERDVHQLPDNQVQPQSLHQRSVSGVSGMSTEGYYANQPSGQQSYELPGQNAGGQQQGSGRYDRVPFRPGHYSASQNF
ncbi:hypothetical protein LTS07_001920 [Exophiala sideris]|uniref:Uncharacterized protein n=1 Tax=Exophiala sideris TaxID=1016849 RepID=A0ABR0JKZ6_9EURO|nr:hypothetical protein LTR13_007414 [Exophiala sideris]KAK5036195.1 hypothetical protein LTS07_001920 [Exophiala sideris]KAK5066578.1 hypothetical protein LTR69_001924 [Exophiala sideris]KAK5180400.1 hypothetical protein LTR44_007157 [Eurotiomycetes sp. CCFEE 6388]